MEKNVQYEMGTWLRWAPTIGYSFFLSPNYEPSIGFALVYRVYIYIYTHTHVLGFHPE